MHRSRNEYQSITKMRKVVICVEELHSALSAIKWTIESVVERDQDLLLLLHVYSSNTHFKGIKSFNEPAVGTNNHLV
jgi:hypothetical protein